MKKLSLIAAVLALFVAGVLRADDTLNLPVATQGGLVTGDIIYARDANHLGNISAVAVGQVLTSAGTGTKPAWSAAPSFGTSFAVGGGTAITKIVVYSQTITPGSVAAATCAEQTFTVTGLTTADKVFYNPPATDNATSAGQVRVSAANTLAVMYCNPTAGALTPGAGTGIVVAFRS